MTILHGVRVDSDGTRTDITTTLDDLPTFTEKHLDGMVEYAHYGTPEQAITVLVYEFSVFTMPANPVATQFVETVRRGPLSYKLHGTVLIFGFDGREDVTTLEPQLYDQLLAFTPVEEVTAS